MPTLTDRAARFTARLKASDRRYALGFVAGDAISPSDFSSLSHLPTVAPCAALSRAEDVHARADAASRENDAASAFISAAPDGSFPLTALRRGLMFIRFTAR